jgi:hypothetical protein
LERAMLNNLSAEIRECHRHAGDCARQAAAQTDPKMKEEFLVMERRWRSFANGYEIAQYLTDFSC